MNPVGTTQQGEQLADLAKQLQGASSFRSAELAEQITANLAETYRRPNEHFAKALSEAAEPSPGLWRAAEELRVAIESTTFVPTETWKEQIAELGQIFASQYDDLIMALTQASEGSQQTAEEIRSAIDAVAKASQGGDGRARVKNSWRRHSKGKRMYSRNSPTDCWHQRNGWVEHPGPGVDGQHDHCSQGAPFARSGGFAIEMRPSCAHRHTS